MKTILIALMMLPTLALAAPTGHQICRDKSGRVELVYGTYAEAYDGADVTIDGQGYLTDVNAGDETGPLYQKLIPFCLCGPQKGAELGKIQWDVEGDLSTAAKAKVSFEIGNVRVSNLELECKTRDLKQGNEQN